jgi:hypothetical protein
MVLTALSRHGNLVPNDGMVVPPAPLISTLREDGIEVTAIHNHMLMDEPRTFFVHFWANDDAVRLAGSVRAALEKTNVPPKGK